MFLFLSFQGDQNYVTNCCPKYPSYILLIVI